MTSPSTSATAPAVPATPPMRVEHLGGDRFAIDVRGHRLLVDQPADLGGEDSAPTPTELFVASLASCVAFYARRYLRRHDLDATGLAVEAGFVLATKPGRVTDIELRLTLPEGFPQDRRAALLAVAGHCTVHNSITSAPEILLRLADEE